MCWVTAAFFMFMVVSGVKIAGGDGGRLGLAKTMLPRVDGVVLFFIFAFAGLAALIAAAGLGKGRRWAWFLSLALAVISLPIVLIGTVPGIFILTGVLNGKSREWFNEKSSGGRRQGPSVGPLKQSAGGN